jgi:hypothetical protein
MKLLLSFVRLIDRYYCHSFEFIFGSCIFSDVLEVEAICGISEYILRSIFA